jgi:hypothetical protein
MSESALQAFQVSYPTANGVQYISANYSIDNGTYFYGYLTFPDFESASNFADATITVSSNISLTDYPAATLTAKVNRTAYGSSIEPAEGNVVVVLAYGGQSVTINAEKTSETVSLTITNPDGVKLIVSGTPAGTTGEVSVDGTHVGTIEDGGGIPLIRFTDGTFVSLN